jgi:hypothetical protein
MKNLDDVAEEIINDESASAEAIRSLIKVTAKESGKDSEVELKTDLSSNEVKIHSIIDILGKIIESSSKEFSTKSIFPLVVEKIERKLLSKERKSRTEIVTVARQPDMNQNEFNVQGEGAIKRFMLGRRNNI